MSPNDVVTQVTQAVFLVLWLSLPPIAAAATVGLLFSLVQALTQIQEQTVSFALKLLATVAVLFLTARWAGGELYNYTLILLDGLWLPFR